MHLVINAELKKKRMYDIEILDTDKKVGYQVFKSQVLLVYLTSCLLCFNLHWNARLINTDMGHN